jgi:protein-S-isoprenylcysteine O-methyltransferase Ste14
MSAVVGERQPRPSTQKKRRLIPPVYLLLTLLAMGLLHWLLPVAHVVTAPYTYIGVPLLLAGICVTSTAARAFAKAGTSVVPFEQATALVTDGLYRYTRNPMYVGLVTIALGVWLLLGSLSALAPVVAFIGVIEFHFIHAEERFLAALFGAPYISYRQRVRRWL